VGDKVWLLHGYIKTSHPSTKLNFKHLGKFRILQKVSSHAYKLDLPVSMKIHLVFYISLLELAAIDPLPDQIQPPPLLVIIDDELEWEVDEIVDSHLCGQTLKYLVHWIGFEELI